jgi:acetoin utilization protein AcuB
MDHAAVPTVSDYMTAAPYCVAPSDPLARAHRIMHEHEIRHLPVLRGPDLVGILSDRDLNLVETLAHVRPEAITVEDAMTPNPYAVAPDLPLSKVARVMVDRKIGSAVVVEGNRVAGIFTMTDALGALIEALDGTYSRRTYEGVTTQPSVDTRGGPDVR